MFSKDEKADLRKQFWAEFKTYSNKRKLKLKKSGKWILNSTGINYLNLKFEFTEEHASAGIEVETRNLDKRIDLFDKLEKLKTILESKVGQALIWELEYDKTPEHTVSYIYAQLNEVNIYQKSCWLQVFKFLFDIMDPIEEVFLEYKDYLKYI